MKKDLWYEDTVYEKAVSLIEDYESKKEKETACFKAGICPVCGGSLNLYTQKKTIKLFWLFNLPWKKKIVACINNCALRNINNKDLNDSERSACINCINSELKEYYWKKLRDRRDESDILI